MGKNGIRIIYGDNPKQMVKELLEVIKPEEEIDENALIGIKPNLVVAKPSSSGATTTPEIVEGLIEHLKSKGRNNIVIMESSWVGDRTSEAFKVCGYENLSKKYNVPLIDLQKDKYKTYEVNGLKINVCDYVTKVDYLINMPVLKGHCQTNITCALKNMKGCIPNTDKRKFHTLGLHKPIAYLNKIVKQSLIIVDGMNGDLNFEEGGNPVQMNRIIAGKDPVLIDTYAAHLMGFSIEEVPYVAMAESIGVGTTDLANADIVELNKDNGSRKLTPSRRVQQLSRHIVEDCACSACYGSLIYALERLNEKGLLNRLKEKLYIGQSFKSKQCNGVGIGACTSGFEKCISGCPPKARDIVEYLERLI
ncbi:iron-sulfur cluster-binding protein [Clostridium thermosuccinogenes]|uniref:Iron-sulfur cluster-binding protein n=1 Tax=Clostridium thermosuccinogenes TaxID=84032 RepID=A0A2K2FAC1_9CLOT|nr:DUF362 domain-containing protein [Pseudoclostridium thermosuccinogenes]AUS98812.1 iron-sulfur cluster-binding protein [Pseudoclostridium thermosuccinogenes]PNT94323.1 iron-sulfur cluster-binding protein [Pseudoclostridium thermosuccinogenes]PNT95041.1 iron-sulfur cluster-binding protein [Pseudoclostridium thermosuccinogenes]PNT95741.1 iron-sulfur cluster-binding protein [Pseudoclostridium thermosuccinogenes]